MRFAFFILTITLCINSISAQDIEVKKFEPMEKDQTAALSPRKDINGVTCGLVKVLLKEPGAEFEGSVMGDVQFTGNEYLVYLPNGTKRLGIKHPDYLPTTVVFADYGTKKVASSTTYELKVKANKKKAKVDNSKKGIAVFNIKPSNAMLLIDGEIADGLGGTYTLSLPYGTHYYTVKLKDFSITNQQVKIDKNSKTIDVDLTEYFAKVDISCMTEDAEILVNGEQKGFGKWSGQTVPGKYSVIVQKEGYHPQTRQIEIKDNDTVRVDISALKMITGSLSVDYEPAGADVLLNGKKVGVTPLYIKELPVGSYQIEIKKDYYVNKKNKIEVAEGQIINEKGKLTMTSFGGVYYNFYDNSSESYKETLIDYYRIGAYSGERGSLAYCERDIIKTPMNPIMAVKLLKENRENNRIDDKIYIDNILKYCGSLEIDDATISFNLAKATMEHWDDLGIPYCSENSRFVPLAWHYFYGIGCDKDEEKAKNLMKQACKKFSLSLYDVDDLNENDLPTNLRCVKEKYCTILEADNAYAFPAWCDLVNDMGLSGELLYVPDYIREKAPQLFDTIFPGKGDNLFNTGFYSHE